MDRRLFVVVTIFMQGISGIYTIIILRIILIRIIPGHALHEKGLQRHMGDGPLVSSSERRAGFVPRINRLSTGPDFLFPTGLSRSLFIRASEESFKTGLFDALRGKRAGRLQGKPSCRRLFLPRPVPSRRAPPRPDPPVNYPGFGFPDMPCIKKVYSVKEAAVYWSAARN